jgi:hypothetical protein
MKTLIQKSRRFIYTRILVLFNLSAVAFTFQACYGMPQDDWMDVMITGYVYASDTHEPIPGIGVAAENGTYSNTDQDGYFSIRAEQDSLYNIIASDLDGEENGEFWNKTTTLADTLHTNEMSLKVYLNRK